MVGYSFDHEFNDTFTVRRTCALRKIKSRKRAYMATAWLGSAVYQRRRCTQGESMFKFPQSEWNHTLTRQYVIDNEK